MLDPSSPAGTMVFSPADNAYGYVCAASAPAGGGEGVPVAFTARGEEYPTLEVFDAAALEPGPAHVDYPHPEGHLHDCPACEVCCHCTAPGQSGPPAGVTHCVYHAVDNPHRD